MNPIPQQQPNQPSNLPPAVQSPHSAYQSTFKPTQTDGRQPLLGVVVGEKGGGKTYTTNKLIYQYVTGTLEGNPHPRKVLILDVNDEFSHIPSLSIKDIIRFSATNLIQARRIRPWKEDGNTMTLDDIKDTLSIIVKYFREGLLLVEDISLYITDSVPGDVVGGICTNRHKGCDIIIHFQGIGAITPKIWRNLNWVRFHKNGESVHVHRGKFPDKEEPLKILEALVNQQVKKGGDNQWFYAYLNLERKGKKIQGAFSQKAFYDAVLLYLEENYNAVIKPLINRIDIRSGTFSKMSPEEAVKKASSKLFLTYYGNSDPMPI